jgi:hypothetical protein
MSGKHVLAISLAVVLLGMLGATIRIPTVEASGTIHMRSYGLIIYAKDTAGNTGVWEMVYFSTGTQLPEPQPEPKRAVPWQLWIIIAIVAIVLFGAVIAARAIMIYERI